MTTRGRLLVAAAALAPAALLAGCVDQPPDPVRGTIVFRGDFLANRVTPDPFDNSYTGALHVDDYERFDGLPTVRIDVPASSASPGYSGGVWTAATPLDLSRTTALTFWTKAVRAGRLDQVGFGMDFVTDKRFQTALFGLPLTTEWTRHRIPIADPARLTPQRGLFWYAATSASPTALWFADVRFEDVPAADLDLQPSLALTTLTLAPGTRSAFPWAVTYADFDGTRRTLDSGAAGVGPGPAFLSFASSDTSVATVDANGMILGAGAGHAQITASVAGIPFAQALDVTVLASLPSSPTAGPAAPAYAQADVISLFSNTYPNRTVASYYADWSDRDGANGNVRYPGSSSAQVPVGGNTALQYTKLHYAGVDFVANRIDASAMAYLHVDVWTPDATKLGVKLVSFPIPGNTTTSVSATVALSGRTSPAIVPSTWISVDIPLSAFAGVPLGSLGQLLWLDNGAIGSGGDEAGTFFIDNVYFHK